MDRLLAPFLTHERPTRSTNTYALVDGARMERRGDGLLVYRDCKLIGSGETPGAAIPALLTSLNRAAVDHSDLFASHAGVVSVAGTAVAFPAESGRGKSTLTAACLLAGFDYVSDEAISVDIVEGTVVPYQKPLGLSEWSRDALGITDLDLTFPPGPHEGYVTATDLGARAATQPLKLVHVVIPEFGHGESTLEEVAGSEAMRLLLEMSFNHYKFGVEAFQLTSRLANRSTAWKLQYGDPLEAGDLLRERLAPSPLRDSSAP